MTAYGILIVKLLVKVIPCGNNFNNKGPKYNVHAENFDAFLSLIGLLIMLNTCSLCCHTIAGSVVGIGMKSCLALAHV